MTHLRATLSVVASILLVPYANAADEPPQPEPTLGSPQSFDSGLTTHVPITQGSELRSRPEADAPILDRLPAGRLPALGWHGSWVEVRYGEQVGWIDADDPIREPLSTSGLGRPRPADLTVPKAFRPPVGDHWHRWQLGPYQLYTDIEGQRVVDRLNTVADQVTTLHDQRYGSQLEPPPLTIILFDQKADFRTQVDSWRRQLGLAERSVDDHSVGYAVPGWIALYRQGRERGQLRAALVHEIAHQLDWRTFGQLPTWLAEGAAEDLALSWLDGDSELQIEPLTTRNLLYGHDLADELAALVSGPSGRLRLERFVAMSSDDFFADPMGDHYLIAATWVRFLHDRFPEALRTHMKSYGEVGEPVPLLELIDQPPRQVTFAYRAWLAAQYRALRSLSL